MNIRKNTWQDLCKTCFFCSNFFFYICYFICYFFFLWYNKLLGGDVYEFHITKSKNALSFYIDKNLYVKANGSTSFCHCPNLALLNQLIVKHGPTEMMLRMAKNEVKLETERY